MTSISLSYKDERSDKVYQAEIRAEGDGYVVDFAYGRRGSTLQTGSKTAKPVSLEEAQKIYDRIVNEKISKGYQPDEGGMAYTNPDKEDSGYRPQLLNPISEDDVESYIDNAEWCAQQKFNGKRIMIIKRGRSVQGANRKGIYCGIPEVIANAFMKFPGDCVVDGEMVGELYYAFDVLESNSVPVTSRPYAERLDVLHSLCNVIADIRVNEAITARSTHDKRALLKFMQDNNREGVVFKKLSAAYKPGRPNSYGDQVKYKLYATLSAVAGPANGSKRSITLWLYKGQLSVECGSVTIPSNHEMPQAGDVVEVRYLYATPAGILYQPIYEGPRDDIDPAACTVDQLKFEGVEDDQ